MTPIQTTEYIHVLEDLLVRAVQHICAGWQTPASEQLVNDIQEALTLGRLNSEAPRGNAPTGWC